MVLFYYTLSPRDEWSKSTLPNNNLVSDPNQRVAGMELPRFKWSVLNRLSTGHGRCADMMHKWRLRDSPTCDCGNHRRPVNHIIIEYKLKKFNQGIDRIHAITPGAIKRITEWNGISLFVPKWLWCNNHLSWIPYISYRYYSIFTLI